MIPAQDVEQKKMVFMAGKNYCHKCSIAILGRAPSQIIKNINTSTNKLPGTHAKQLPNSLKASVKPAVTSTPSHVSFSHKTEGKTQDKYTAQKKTSSKNIYIIGGVAVGIVLLIILIIILGGESSSSASKKTPAKTAVIPKKEQPKMPSSEEILATAKKAFDSVVDYENKNPLASNEIIVRIEKNTKLVVNTEYEAKLREKKYEHEGKKKFLDEVNDYIISFNKNPSDYTHYINSYKQLKDKAQSLNNNKDIINFIDEQINKVNEAINREALTEFEKLKEEVAELKKENFFDEAISRCESFPELLRANKTVAEEITNLITELKSAREIYLRKKQNDWKFLFNEDNMDISDWFAFPAETIKAKIIKENKTLSLENGGSSKQQEQEGFGFIILGDSLWKNYTVEVEYKVTQGAANLAVRFDYQPLKEALRQGPNPDITLKPPHLIPLQRTFADNWLKVNIEVKDGDVIIKEDGKQEQKKKIPQQVSEQGGFGFVLRSGDKILVKSIKVKGAE
jgi:hypothetical protein